VVNSPLSIVGGGFWGKADLNVHSFAAMRPGSYSVSAGMLDRKVGKLFDGSCFKNPACAVLLFRAVGVLPTFATASAIGGHREKTKIFISYPAGDASEALLIAKASQARGYNVSSTRRPWARDNPTTTRSRELFVILSELGYAQ
jgi:hypothetical protein